MKEKVVFYIAGPEFDGESVDRTGVGGSESALTFMAREFSKLGFETHVYCNCRRPKEYAGVLYHHFEEPIMDCTYLFCYRYPEPLSVVKAKVKILVLHDMPVIQERIAKVLWAVDKIFFLSDYQKNRWLKEFPSMGKISYLTRNGFAKEYVARCDKRKHQVVFASRPERGLDILLEKIWPVIYSEDPALQLILAGYGDWKEPELKDFYEKCDKLISESSNITYAGNLSKPDFYSLLGESKCVVYPLAFPEVSCLVAIEAEAAGTPIVTSDGWALPESVGKGSLVSDKPGSPSYCKVFVSEVLRLVVWGCAADEISIPPKAKSWSEIALGWSRYLQDYSRKKPESIAVCVVAKNEEDNIIRCLKSLQNIGFIKVLVDSSQDRTFTLASLYADEVIKVSFADLDFAELRREMVRGVISDWILWMDADEVLINGAGLHKYTESESCDAYRLKQVNVTLESSKWGQETPIRLFKNQRGVSFVGKIHEQVEFADYLEPGPLPLIDDVMIAHLGYLIEDLVWKKLMSRNKVLLEEEIKSGSARPLLPLYKMRDLMNEFVRLKLSSSSEEVEKLLEGMILIWEKDYEVDFTKPQRELAWKLYQNALQELHRRGVLFRGEIPKYVDLKLELDRGGGIKLAAWFRSKSEYLAKLGTLVKDGGDLLWK